MLKRARLRLVAAVVGGGLLLLAGWLAWQGWQVQRDLADAADRAAAIQRLVAARDDTGSDGDARLDTRLDHELDGLRAASAAAAERTSGPAWRLLTHLPVVGDDAAGVATTSRVLDELSRDGVAPLVRAAGRFDRLVPRDGVLDLAVARDLVEPVARADRAFDRARRRLAAVDDRGFAGPLARRFTSFEDQVDRAARALGPARVATEVLPAMLGGDGPRRYLLVFQNNAEVRSTGGLPGAASYVEARGGRLTMRAHVTGASFGEAPAPVLPLSAAERALYGDVLGTYFVDATMTPDVPRAADLLRARWQQRYPDRPVDGVVLVDAVAIGYLLDATGPVRVGGVRLSGDNVVDELLHRAYLRLPEPRRQDAFFARVAAATLDRLTAGSGDPRALLAALSRAADERRVFVHSFVAADRAALAGTAVAGELDVPGPGSGRPRVDVTLDDTTGAKMSYYLRYDVHVTATSCVAGVQKYAAKARLRSTAPPDAASLPAYVTGGGRYGVPAGSQLVTLRIFAPAGGELGALTWNGEPLELERVEHDGRPVGMTYVQLDPGQVADLAWTMRSGPRQVGTTALAVTPTIERKDGAETLASACSPGR
ncbi:DUF4012 domain-containing protein [Pimelobacter simplex]|uniref:DUF4012 domain-containing protein n=1 Tax=Nocardioides simplex TaxID=2045 RepID=A0A7J5E239_NOCSI|nr:DUF4012 domain-containing protein [Pimelobacter simplex]KAB2812207.1 DUF4012 domain-containing protein [Pimelobacter simplex]